MQALKSETAMNYRKRIVRDPHAIGVEPVFKGMRVTLRTVSASLAELDTQAARQESRQRHLQVMTRRVSS